jgi:hypothetical protein
MQQESIWESRLAHARTKNLKVVCAWCDNTIREGEPGAPVSHGICPPCADDQRKQFGLPPATRHMVE